MITSLIVTTVLGVVSGVLGALPTFSWPSAFGDGEAVGSFAYYANAVFPVDALLAALAFVMTFIGVMAAVHGALFIWHQIHGSE